MSVFDDIKKRLPEQLTGKSKRHGRKRKPAKPRGNKAAPAQRNNSGARRPKATTQRSRATTTNASVTPSAKQGKGRKRKLKKPNIRRGSIASRIFARVGRRTKVGERPQVVASKSPTLRPISPLPPSAVERLRKNSTRPVREKTAAVRGFIQSPRLVSSVILALCVAILWSATTNNRFYLNYVDVEGLSYLVPDQIVDMSGLRGMHIFGIQTESAADAVEQIPGVISADVVVEWPGNVRILVQEDVPQLIWVEAGVSYWVNGDGVLSNVQDQNVELLTVMADFGFTTPPPHPLDEELEDGEEPPVRPRTVPVSLIDGAQQVIAAFPNASSLAYREIGGLTIVAEQGWTAHFGNGDEMAYKLAAYSTIVNKLQAEGTTIEYIDLTNANRPVYKPIVTATDENISDQ